MRYVLYRGELATSVLSHLVTTAVEAELVLQNLRDIRVRLIFMCSSHYKLQPCYIWAYLVETNVSYEIIWINFLVLL